MELILDNLNNLIRQVHIVKNRVKELQFGWIGVLLLKLF